MDVRPSQKKEPKGVDNELASEPTKGTDPTRRDASNERKKENDDGSEQFSGRPS